MIQWGRVDPDRVQPILRQGLEAALGPLPDLWLVIYGIRTHDEQAALYATYQAGGPKAAPPGLSPHEYGLAVDVVLDVDGQVGGAVSWDTTKYRAQWRRMWAAVDRSLVLHSGRWFGDGDHIEVVQWRKYLRAG